MNKTFLENRFEFLALVQAVMANPNGDPDMMNLSRKDYETGRGIITDVAVKARSRGYMDEAHGDEEGYEILMRNGTNLNRNIAEAVINTGIDKKDKTDAAAYMCRKYWDVRTYGGVLSTGCNAGQVRGAVQIAMLQSVDPIDPISTTITRRCYAEGKFTKLEEYDKQDAAMDSSKKRKFGNKQYIPYGLYVLKGTVSANIAQKVGFDNKDLGYFLESIMQMYNMDASSSKMGMSVLSPLILFKHVGTTDEKTNPKQAENERKLGCAPSYKLFDMLTIKRKENVEVARNYTDYNIQLHMENLPSGVICGLKNTPYTDVEWLSTSNTIDLAKLI